MLGELWCCVMTAKSLRHKFVSLVPDRPNPNLVVASSWNDDHNLWLGYREITLATDVIAPDDHLSLLSYKNDVGVAVTLPAPAANSFQLGWKATLFNLGAGDVTVTPATTINGSSAPAVLAQDESVAIYGTGTADFRAVFSAVAAEISLDDGEY